MYASSTLAHPLRRLAIVLGALGAAAIALTAGLAVLWTALAAQPSPVAASPDGGAAVAASPITEGSDVRVLIFFAESEGASCLECHLHRLRLAYWAYQFQGAGAAVFGVEHADPKGVGEDSELAPWRTVSDRGGEIASYYGVARAEARENPTVVVLGRDGRVIYRARPSDIDDRVEGEVLTTIAMANTDDRMALETSAAR